MYLVNCGIALAGGVLWVLSRGLRRKLEGLRDVVGRDKVYSDPAIVRLYAREPSGAQVFPENTAVAFPESVEDVSKIVRYAYKNDIYIYPQGSTSSLVGGAVPDKEGVVISFQRMNRILDVRVVDSYVDVEPGVRLGDLNLELAKYGYMFPIDPGSVSVATVGGAVNTGAGGLRGAKYGTTRDWVLGLTIVLPDEQGSVLRIGCRTLKCRQGYDLTRLIVGSEGTLAIVVEATLKITPIPENVVTALGFYDDLRSLSNTVVEIKSSGVQPMILEFMDDKSARAAAEAINAPVKPEGHMLLAGIDVNREATDRFVKWLSDIMKRNGARKVYTARTLEEAEEKKLFEIRRNLFPAQVKVASKFVRPGSKLIVYIEDIAVPPSRLPEAVERLRELEEKYRLVGLLGGHIGDGNLHPIVGFPADDEDMKARVSEWYEEVMKIALELGGTISSEHGIGTFKRKGLEMELSHLGSLKALELMRGIKRVFDPKGLLNPGKVVG